MKKVITIISLVVFSYSFAAIPSQKNSYVKIDLPKIENASSYTVEVYSEKNKNKPIYKSRNTSNKFSWINPQPGKYQYRIKYEDESGNESAFSGFAKLEIN